jgi:hypothetical protein
MATCPKCGGFLRSGHRCPWSVRRRLLIRSFRVAAGGALIGLVLAAAAPTPGPFLVILGGGLGAVLSTAFWKLMTGRR